MSQQRTARRQPSLLVDPAQETVRRRCRDPINVENLLLLARCGGPVL
uniref:E2F transcription factor 6 n=1 Tax=Mus musculus TaxID=10090 RepID=Q8K455_MOUSE|nr:transcriptional repressor E2F6 splice variant [Mus musculus]